MTWDGIIRKRLPRLRRFYIYFEGEPPKEPMDASASFTPQVIPPPHPSMFSALALLVIVILLYSLILDIIKHGYWQRILLFNAVLLLLILIGYGTYFLAVLLGKSHYFRFAPGIVQLIKYKLLFRRPAIETYRLGELDVVLDVSGSSPAMTFLNTPGYKRETFRLSHGEEVIEALFRAVLSTAPSPPLPEENLVE